MFLFEGREFLYFVGQVNAELSLERIDCYQSRVTQSGHIDRFVRVHAAQIDHTLQLKQGNRHILTLQA